jgi:hypothetical protein
MPAMEEVAIPLLFFPIGILRFFEQAGAPDWVAITAAVCLSVSCVIAFMGGLFHQRKQARGIFLMASVSILLLGIVGWHWQSHELRTAQSSRRNLILGTPLID